MGGVSRHRPGQARAIHGRALISCRIGPGEPSSDHPAPRPRPARSRSAFTIMDVLVSMVVVTILIALLTPTLWTVRETARRVICGSNIRQLGIGIALYADDHHDRLPPSQFLGTKGEKGKPQEMLRLRVDKQTDGVTKTDWDGLGYLFSGAYLPEGHIFYCPSHKGLHTFQTYDQQWRIAAEETNIAGSIVGNYQFRGKGPNNTTLLSRILPTSTALVADGLRTQAEFNHQVGGNVLRADLSVFWFRDGNGLILAVLPPGEGEAKDTEEAWAFLDEALAK